MFDSIEADQLPEGAPAVAGYVDGNWVTFPELVVKFPNAARLSIATNPHNSARCLDVEKGNALIPQAVNWVKAQLQAGRKRPVLYASVSTWPQLEAALKAGGVKRGFPGRRRYRRWTAHYTGHPHRCTRNCWPGFRGRAAATQYTDHADGRNLDASLCSRDFLR